MNECLTTMMRIAADAAKLVMEVYERPFTVDYKAPSDPVTEADRRANDFICRELKKAFPTIPIVAEESPREQWQGYQTADKVFFVDPVDGTREFVAKSGQFVVMIGLLEGERPTHGVLHAPAQKTIWAGAVGQGAIRIDPDGQQHKLRNLQECRLAEARLVSSMSQRGAINDRALDLLKPKEIFPIGSAGLKGAAVADGRADIYVAPQFAGCRWDSCAPEALIRAVGGRLSDAHGELIDYRSDRVENNRGAVAAAPQLHLEVVDRLKPLFR